MGSLSLAGYGIAVFGMILALRLECLLCLQFDLITWVRPQLAILVIPIRAMLLVWLMLQLTTSMLLVAYPLRSEGYVITWFAVRADMGYCG